MGDLGLVITCVNRKAHAPTANLQVRAVPGGCVDRRVRDWCSRLDADGQRTPLSELYLGELWRESMALVQAASGRANVRACVCSAGLGLRPLTHEAMSYAATFTSGHADTVAGTVREQREWWAELNEARGLGRTPIATLASDTGHVVVVASRGYLRAIEDDVAEAMEQSPVTVVCTGAVPARLRPAALPLRGKVQEVVGGSRLASNPRAARWVFEHAASTEPMALVVAADRLMSSAPEQAKITRTQVEDHEVVSFIRGQLAASPAGYTRLLRRFRGIGKACEQRRFRELYAAVVAEAGT